MSPTDTMALVAEIGQLHFEGNITPPSWFQHLKYPSGKPYLIAITILAEIVYWYRPRHIRDEDTGQFIGIEKKFKGDQLQRDYASFGEQFGFTKREATDAIKYLVSRGIVRTQLRTVIRFGMKMANVLYLSLTPEKLKEITYGRHGKPVNGRGLPFQRNTPSVEAEYPSRTEDPLRQDQTPTDDAAQEPPTVGRGITKEENNTEIFTENTREIWRTYRIRTSTHPHER